jgi:hypothetical protein
MNSETVIYSRTHTHKGHAFQVWSYLDDPDPKRSTMLFAYRVEGVTVGGLPDRAEAIHKARQRIDEQAAKPVQETPAADPPQAIQDPHPQQHDLSRRSDPAKQTQGELFP